MKVHLLSSDHENAQETQWEVPFDPSLKEVTVSLSGPGPQIELRDPLGKNTLLFCTDIFALKTYQLFCDLKYRDGIWGKHSFLKLYDL